MTVRIALVLIAFTMLGASPGLYAANAWFLDGFWAITIKTPTGNGFLPDEIQVLANFTLDGSLLASSNLPPIPVAVPGLPPTFKEGEGHGAWVRTGYGKFYLEVWRFAALPDGTNAGFAKGQANVTINQHGDGLEGTIRLQLMNTVGPPAPPLFGTVAGKRIEPVPVKTTP
jgi:hypothetical protein